MADEDLIGTENQAIPNSQVAGLEACSASRVSPAAGTAAAITGALGVSLLINLARLTPPCRILDCDQMLARLLAVPEQLAALSSADASAIVTWLPTRQLPTGDPACQAALEALVKTPFEAAELCRAVRVEPDHCRSAAFLLPYIRR